jgi:7-cyano-7-deazaguanine synthase
MSTIETLTRSAVLLSGGLDSVVMMALELKSGRDVWPVHVRVGLAWEESEAVAITRLVREPPFAGRVQPTTTLSLDMRDVYAPGHWAVDGRAPAWAEPDETVYLEGRNITLIAKAAVFCAGRGIERLVLGPLAGNPFPDATPIFFETIARAMSLGLGQPLHVATPLAHMHKADVVRAGVELGVVLEQTLSCMSPVGHGHCGRCNKCRERHEAFRDAGIEDPTVYARAPNRGREAT